MLHRRIGDRDQHLRKQTKVSVFLIITVSDMAKDKKAVPTEYQSAQILTMQH